jgi:peptide/nickel transport system permease protein
VKLLWISLLKYLVSLLLVGFVATALVRLAPGFGTDERELDSRLSTTTIEYLKQRNPNISISATYLQFLGAAVQGDFGFSQLFNRPVRELLEERHSITTKIAGAGWIVGWTCALVLAAFACIFPPAVFRGTGALTSSVVLCVPAALLGFGVAVAQAPAFLAVAALVFARVFPLIDSQFRAAQASPFVTGARARGAVEHRIFTRHVMGSSWAELIALAGTSIAIAIGVTVPVEVLSDNPGVGQLAWKAAIGRDLPLLVSITLAVGAITMFFTTSADLMVTFLRRRTG